MVVRFRLDAALYAQAPARKPKQKGAPRKKGKRLPTLEQRLTSKKTKWQRLTIPQWYGEGQRVIELCSDIGVWYHSGQPTVLLRWVLLRDPQGKFKSQALLCTDPRVAPQQMVQWFILRWQLEVTLEEVRALGSRDAAPMVGQGDCTHDACLVGLVFARHLARPSQCTTWHVTCASSRMVCQDHTHLFRCLGTGASDLMAAFAFFNVQAHKRHIKNIATPN